MISKLFSGAVSLIKFTLIHFNEAALEAKRVLAPVHLRGGASTEIDGSDSGLGEFVKIWA